MKFFNTDDLVTMRLTGETKHSDANSSYIFPNPRPIVSYGVRPPPPLFSYTTPRITDDVFPRN